tara:strand:+ start:74 stop:517 length:444 start_codon:yes stop_codon:yes gene_type:complete
MLARKWNVKKDYPLILKWCQQRDWDSPIPQETLPAIGVMITDKEAICAAGLFVDKTSKLGFMWGIFSNPKTSKIKLFKAMKMCVEEIKKQATKNKIFLIYTITGENALHKLYSKHIGMYSCENNINSYIMNLNKKKYKNLDWITDGK